MLPRTSQLPPCLASQRSVASQSVPLRACELTRPAPQDGFEESLQINHLSHFLLCSLLIEDIRRSSDPRIIVVGSITGNTNTVGGGLVWPKASLGAFEGMQQMAGGAKGVPMIDGRAFNGAKAYKDSKLCNMQTILQLHDRYHAATGIAFSTMYPGCIAETQLFREKRTWFRTLFPVFMKYVTGGYVSEPEAGERLAQCVWDDRCRESGKYWSWNGGARTVGGFSFTRGYVVGAGGGGGGADALFANPPSAEVRDRAKAERMFELSSQLTGAKWPTA
jgi:protochlorophyllide reductase